MEIINKIFGLCVKALHTAADLTGTSYEFVNVMLFCVLGPLVLLIYIFRVYSLKKEMNKYKGLYEKFVREDINNKE